MSVDYPEPVELNTQIRTLRKPSGIAVGRNSNFISVFVSNNHGTEIAAVFDVGTGDSGNLLRMYDSLPFILLENLLFAYYYNMIKY